MGSTLWLFFGVGLLLAYIFGAFLPYHLVPWASIPFSIVFLFGFFHVPDTPLHLLKIGKYEASVIEVGININFSFTISGCRGCVKVLSRRAAMCTKCNA